MDLQSKSDQRIEKSASNMDILKIVKSFFCIRYLVGKYKRLENVTFSAAKFALLTVKNCVSMLLKEII